MGNKVPFSTIYFCGNCEEEVVGLPAGARVASGRPLCLRCAQIGEAEGWGRSNAPAPDTRVYEVTGKRSVIGLLFWMVLVMAVCFVCSALLASNARR